MEEKSWVCTVITQLSLCIAAYIALSIGQPRESTHGEGRQIDMHFITVAGGFRPLEQQTLLLQQMVKVAKTYKTRFVVFVSELGESDPLLQRAMMFPELLTMPWYTTGDLGGHGVKYLLKKIKVPYGQTLDIVALDTMLFQDTSSVHGNDHILWLTRTLNESDSDWRIVFGLHKLISCDYNIWKMDDETPFKPLHNILLHYGVDAYMSMKICTGHTQGGEIGLSDHTGPVNQNSVFKEERLDGLLLHQVSSLEMVTFVVKLTGEIEHKQSFEQSGRAVM